MKFRIQTYVQCMCASINTKINIQMLQCRVFRKIDGPLHVCCHNCLGLLKHQQNCLRIHVTEIFLQSLFFVSCLSFSPVFSPENWLVISFAHYSFFKKKNSYIYFLVFLSHLKHYKNIPGNWTVERHRILLCWKLVQQKCHQRELAENINYLRTKNEKKYTSRTNFILTKQFSSKLASAT